jgi:hypothetical protein
LLAITPDGSLVLIELKRARTPREVVAQALDYAGWVERLRADEIAKIYGRFAPAKSLAGDFLNQFGQKLDEGSLNQSHQIIIVASSLDDSTERIISYLNDRDVPINVLFFQVFTNGGEQLLSRSWLLDPVRTQVNAAATPPGPSEPWNGEFYCSFGEGNDERSWLEASEHGFISGGGGAWYSRTLQLLCPDDRVWVKIPDVGSSALVGPPAGPNPPRASDCRRPPARRPHWKFSALRATTESLLTTLSDVSTSSRFGGFKPYPRSEPSMRRGSSETRIQCASLRRQSGGQRSIV